MIGIDLVSIERIEAFITRYGDRGLARFLTPDEIALVRSPKTAAGFWALKEAVSKALGCGIGSELGFHDMIITKSSRGAPQLHLSESAAKRHGVGEFAVSLTHDNGMAVAVALAKY